MNHFKKASTVKTTPKKNKLDSVSEAMHNVSLATKKVQPLGTVTSTDLN